MRFLLILIIVATACGPRSPKVLAPAKAPPIPSKTPEADKNYRPPNMAWWQGGQPECTAGVLKRRTLSWGSVIWCAMPGVRVDASLQNDLGRLARCVQESVEAFQTEPGEDGLGKFLKRAHDVEATTVLCGAVRRDSQVRTYNGHAVQLERTVLTPPPEGGGVAKVRYRFSCEHCLVASETIVDVALGQ